jgi:WD40 repeat protein
MCLGLDKGLDGQGFEKSTPPVSLVFITFSSPVGIPQAGIVAIGSVEQSITHTAHSSYINDAVTI